MEYHQRPWQLYRQASRGDIDALEKLLRLDSMLLSDPAIGRQLFRLRKHNSAAEKLLLQADSEGRNSKLTLADVKFSLAGLIQKLSQELNRVASREFFEPILLEHTQPAHRLAMRRWIKRQRDRIRRLRRPKFALTAADIRRLFDAVAQDSEGKAIDTDFSQQEPHSFYKRVIRNAKLWPNLYDSDK